MLAALQELISLLASDPLTVQQVAGRLGEVAEDLVASLAVTPAGPDLEEVIIARSIDLTTREPTDVPAFVRLVPAEPPSLETLSEAFGPYREIPPQDLDRLPQAIFYLQLPPEGPCLIALIAEVSDGQAVSITLRRDKLP
jgi:hypothetical protein